MAQRAFDRAMSFPQLAGTSADGVAGGTLPTSSSSSIAGGPTSMVIRGNPSIPAINTTSSSTATTTATATWINEDIAEEDPVLAVLSEGTEIYLRSVLEKALHCARQRQNVDGLRLWHQQCLFHNNKNNNKSTEKSDTNATSQSDNNNNNMDVEDEPAAAADRPALSLRLGCDVKRQVARTAGNAATLCHRAEQALRRRQQQQQQHFEGAVTPEILARASSLSDVALRPKLRQAVEEADAEAKRQLDVYGGRDAKEPFGRLPKRAKLEVIDFKNGMNFARPGRRRHRASTNSSSFQY